MKPILNLGESRWKWPSVFYAHAIVSTILFILFGSLYRNSPKKHPFVGTVELNKIAVGKSSLNKAQLKKIPYGPILSTVAVWAVWLAALGNFVTANIMFLYSPIYMSKVLVDLVIFFNLLNSSTFRNFLFILPDSLPRWRHWLNSVWNCLQDSVATRFVA